MREPLDETAGSLTTDAAGPEGRGARQADPSREDQTHASQERKCVLTGRHGTRGWLIRLVAAPDGVIWPDIGSRLPGRGAWITPDRAHLCAAIANGRLKAALARSLRQPVSVPADLAQRLADALERRALDRLGLEHRGGHLILGSDRIAEWARAGRLHLLVHAGDAATDGAGKLDQALRTSGGDMAMVLWVPVGRAALSRALGRENVVHFGVSDAKGAHRIAADIGRWRAYEGLDSGDRASSGDEVPGDDDSGVGSPQADRRNGEGRE